MRSDSLRATFAETLVALGISFAALTGLVGQGTSQSHPDATELTTVPGMPAVVNGTNLYSETDSGHFSPAVNGALERVYVPNVLSDDVDVIDHFRVGRSPQHVIPSWDLKTLWVAGSKRRFSSGSLIPIDPATGKPGHLIKVPDAYNMYFSPDGSSAIVVAESLNRLEFRDPQTMALKSTLPVPDCRGIAPATSDADNLKPEIQATTGQNLVRLHGGTHAPRPEGRKVP